MPGAAVPGRCLVSESLLEVEADVGAWLVVVRRDVHCNVVETAAGQTPMRATVSGPAPVHPQVLEKGDGSVQVSFRTQVGDERATRAGLLVARAFFQFGPAEAISLTCLECLVVQRMSGQLCA